MKSTAHVHVDNNYVTGIGNAIILHHPSVQRPLRVARARGKMERQCSLAELHTQSEI